MTEWIPKILEFLKLPTKLIASLCLVSGLLVLLPVEYLKKLHLENIETQYGTIIGITFLISSALLILELIIWVGNKIRIAWLRSKLSKTALKALNQLDSKEISVLREFYIQEQSTLLLPMNHPVVAGLIEKGILEQVGSLGENSLVGVLISLTIAPDVKPHITYDLLNLPNREPTEQEIQWVRSNRPEFMAELDRRNYLHYQFGNI
jgi:hypothetical protein